MSEKYYTQEDRDVLAKATSYKELFTVAESILNRMPSPRGQMCGPISTGGTGSREENMKRFDVALEHILKQGIEVFSQMPFEEHIHRIQENSAEKEVYAIGILEDFYLPIFENKLVNTLYFLPDWKTSRGANWEHDQATRLGIEIVYLPDDLFNTYEEKRTRANI